MFLASSTSLFLRCSSVLERTGGSRRCPYHHSAPVPFFSSASTSGGGSGRRDLLIIASPAATSPPARNTPTGGGVGPTSSLFARTIASSKITAAADGDGEPHIPLNTHALRKPYMNVDEPFLGEEHMERCPFQQVDGWFQNVLSIVDLKYQEVNAFAISTVSPDGRPSCRMVLLKGYSSEGFVFFTHSISRKGKELASNPQASMLFYWPRVDRQVRIEGRVVELGAEIAEEYWHKRPIATRIGSKLSEQSAEIPNRQYLEQKQKALEELCRREGEAAITRPDEWLGYALLPDYFEFWQGQSNRVHDRIVYELENGDEETSSGEWRMKRLAP